MVIEAQDGIDLLKKLECCSLKHPYSMILIDMNMPRLNGLETIKKIRSRAQYNTIPTIMLSTSNNVALKQDAYSLGANSFISKPNSFEQYEAIIEGLKAIYFDQIQ